MLKGGDGDDTLQGGAGNDSLEGGIGNDVLGGEEGDDLLFGGSDDDTLEGGIGNDSLDGGDDNDTLRGQEDNDILQGQAGSDVLEGGAGNDVLDGGPGNDVLDGGDGVDRLVFSGSGEEMISDFTTGNDVIDLSLYAPLVFSDLVIEEDPGNPANTLISGYGGAGDNITVEDVVPEDLGPEDFLLQEDSNLIPGTDGDDDIQTTGLPDAVKALGGNDTVTGSAADDIIEGGAGNDTLDGGPDKDTLIGGDDNDTLRGGGDNDLLRGDAGEDRLEGGPGNDVLEGGPGNDTHVFAGDNGQDRITDFEDGDLIDLSFYGLTGLDDFKIEEDPNNSANTLIFGYDNDANLKTSNNITLENVAPGNLTEDDFFFGGSNIIGTEGDDVITVTGTSLGVTGGRPSDADNNIEALGGIDRAEGGLGADFIDGGEGDDILAGAFIDPNDDDTGDGADTLLGGPGKDFMTGGPGDDILEGGADDDTLGGGTGDDMLDGGEGDDTLTGGADNDIFRFTGTTNNDRIPDFTQGQDKIDLSAYPSIQSADQVQDDLNPAIYGRVLSGFNPDRPDDTISLPGVTDKLTDDDYIFAGGSGNSIYISDVQLNEGDSGSATEAVFTVSLSTPVEAPVTVDFATADDTAEAGSDYSAVSGTLTFASGETVQEVRVPIMGDGAVEPNESFFVNLSNPVNDVIADGQGQATILDDDGSGANQSGSGADEVLDGSDGDDVLQGGNGDDALSGLAGDDALSGRSGDDTLDGGAGDDILAGGSGDDTLDGGGDDDVLGGGSGNDELDGGAGDDTLAGGSGDDQLSGGAGNDALIGGSGYDSFVFKAADGDSGHDTIRLFNADEDTLAFEEYGENLNAFSDLDSNANGVLDDGDAHVSVDAGNTVIDLGGQTDGDSDGTIKLVGITGLEADDMAFS